MGVLRAGVVLLDWRDGVGGGVGSQGALLCADDLHYQTSRADKLKRDLVPRLDPVSFCKKPPALQDSRVYAFSMPQQVLHQ